jgi:hypothetical protein
LFGVFRSWQVDREPRRVVDVDVRVASRIDGDVDDELSSDSERNVVVEVKSGRYFMLDRRM